MKTTIDMAGRVVIPKPLRDQLGLVPGTVLDVVAVDDHLEMVVPSRVRVEDGPHGVRFSADTPETLSADGVRELMERGRH